MNKQKLSELINSEIRNALIDKAKGSSSQEKIESSESYLKSEEITEEDFYRVLFFGGSEPVNETSSSRTFTIRENNMNDVKITTTEIKEFEDSFKQFLGALPNATIVFNKQKNGYSLLATKKSDGIDAIASGIINLGSDGKITWFYSIMNGIALNAQNLKLDNDTKMISENLYNHFVVWQKTWREKLNYPQTEDQAI
jgi:hypothetical protein